MKTLLDTIREFVGSLKTGDKLNYITGQNALEVISVDPGGEWIKFQREAIDGTHSEHTVTLSALEEVINELEGGKPVHFETFFHGGGNLRTAYETLVAHSPRVSWCKIDNLKHLKAFDHEVHPSKRLWRSDGDDWSSPEWALATIVYVDVVRNSNMTTIPAPIPALLGQVTSRSENSWQARIANFRSYSDGGGFDGGARTKELCAYWLERYSADSNQVKILAGYSARRDASENALKELRGLIGVDFISTESAGLFGESGGLPGELIRALLSKPFLILTGNSGTGKTRLAEDIAGTYRNADDPTKVKNVALVPVGADWTDSRAVVGFVNHLREGSLNGSSEKRPVYQSTAVVDVLLSANADSAHPHFLILDEMNLSHVERYFADFLSAMESRDGRIRFHDEGPRERDDFRLPRFEGDPLGVPRSVPYPRNLFVIGTVNVDETTYMFSPKVLDRAHVIEFVVDPDDIKTFLENPVAPDQPLRAPESQAKGFLQLGLDARQGKLAAPEGPVRKSINDHLIDLLSLLQLGRFEFAYRTAKEVVAYLAVCYHLAKDKDAWLDNTQLSSEDRKSGKSNWRSDLDDEILQKILPRLHGSRNRIGPLLGALTCYAHEGDLEKAKAYFAQDGAELAEKSIGDPDFTALTEADALFPRSFRKLRTMARVLVEEQFVSFIC